MNSKYLISKRLINSFLNTGIAVMLWGASLPANAGESSAGTGENPVVEKAVLDEKWTLIPMFSFSSLTGGHPSWEEYDTQLFYKVNPNLTIGGEVDVRSRPPSGTDMLFSAMISYSPWKQLEVHGKVTFGPDVSFSPEQEYQVGFEVRPISRVSFLLDYTHFTYHLGAINEIKPGVIYWFSDETFLTLRYAHGRAFGDTDYNGFGGRLNLGLSGKKRVILGYWHGADPERDFGVTNTISIKGNTYSVFYQQPLRRNLDLIVGVEYETHTKSYNRTTGTVGFSYKY